MSIVLAISPMYKWCNDQMSKMKFSWFWHMLNFKEYNLLKGEKSNFFEGNLTQARSKNILATSLESDSFYLCKHWDLFDWFLCVRTLTF